MKASHKIFAAMLFFVVGFLATGFIFHGLGIGFGMNEMLGGAVANAAGALRLISA